MRLSESQVGSIVRKIMDTLKREELVILKHPEGTIIKAMNDAFLDNLRAEDRLVAEAKALLEQAKQKQTGPIDEQKMLTLIKKELVKKYRVII